MSFTGGPGRRVVDGGLGAKTVSHCSRTPLPGLVEILAEGVSHHQVLDLDPVGQVLQTLLEGQVGRVWVVLSVMTSP